MAAYLADRKQNGSMLRTARHRGVLWARLDGIATGKLRQDPRDLLIDDT